MSLSAFVLAKNFFCIYMLLNFYIGQLVKIFRGVQSLAPKRFEIGGVSFRVISSPINGGRGNGFIGSWDQNCGVKTKNGDFLAIFGLWAPFRRP